jgi:hypothetical protein
MSARRTCSYRSLCIRRKRNREIVSANNDGGSHGGDSDGRGGRRKARDEV